MKRKSKYDTRIPDRPKPALWKVIKIFLQLKAEELKDFGWGALLALGYMIATLCICAVGSVCFAGFAIGVYYIAEFICAFLGNHITTPFLNLIGQHTTIGAVRLGRLTIMATMVLLAVLIAIVWFLHWIRDNWIKAKRLAINK